MEVADEAARAINQEQLFHDLEKRFVSLKKDFTLKEGECNSLKARNAKLDQDYKKLQDQQKVQDEAIHALRQKTVLLENQLELSESKVNSYEDIIKRRNDEIISLKDELKSYSSRLIESQKSEKEAQQKRAEYSNLVAPLQSEVQKLKREKDINTAHSQWLDKELNEKLNEILSLKQTHSTKILEVSNELNQLKEKFENAETTIEKLKRIVQGSEKALSEERKRSRDFENEILEKDDKFNKELSTYKRLADLYKESSLEWEKKVNELTDKNAHLKQQLDDANEATQRESERVKTNTESLFKQQAEESLARIRKLEEALARAKANGEENNEENLFNEGKLFQVEKIKNVSAVAVERHLAAQGLTLMEMYNRVVKSENSLRSERQAKEKLELYLSAILKEIEEKAPIIAGQRMDYQRALASYDKLSEKLDTAMQELSTFKSRANSLSKKNLQLETEKRELGQLVDDLGRQVQNLIKTKQNSKAKTGDIGHVAIIPCSDASSVISENLVVFHDIEELQIRNQQLLRVVRQLSSEKEQEEHSQKNSSNSNSQEISLHKNDFNRVVAELEEMKTSRDRQQKMLSAIVHQRDMYRVLLAQKQVDGIEELHQNSPDMPIETESSNSISFNRQLSSFEKSDKGFLEKNTLQEELEQFKKESKENVKLLQATIDKLRADCSNERMAANQAEVQCRFTKEQLETSQMLKKAAEEEVVHYRVKNNEYQNMLLQHQRTISDLTSTIKNIEDKLRSATNSVTTLTAEKETLIANNERLMNSTANLRQDSDRQLNLMESIQRIEASLEMKTFEESARLKEELTVLQGEIKKLRKSADESNILVRQSEHQLELEKEAFRIKIEKEEKKNQEISLENASLIEKIKNYQEKMILLEKQLEHQQEQIRKGAGIAAADQVVSLEIALRSAQQDRTAAIIAQEEIAEQVEEYKAIAEANENALKELSEASIKWKDEQNKHIQMKESKIRETEEQLKKEKEQRQIDLEQFNASQNEIEKVLKACQEEKNQLEKSLSEATAQQEQLVNRELALKEQIEEIKRAYTNAQSNYQRELQLHAEDLKLMQEDKAKRDFYSESLEKVQQDYSSLMASVVNKEKMWNNQKVNDEKMIEELNERIKELTQQNALVHSQLEILTIKMEKVQQDFVVQVSGEESPQNKQDEEERSTQEKSISELRQVVRYLRREKGISESKCELAQQEASRLSSQLFQVQQALDRTKKELLEQLEDAQKIEKLDQQNEKMEAQVNQMNLLRESNALLREESLRNLEKLKLKESCIATLEQQLEPLKKSEAMLKCTIETLNKEMVSLKETNTRWQTRVQQLVEKYHQVDPEEYQQLTAKHANLAQNYQQLKDNHEQLVKISSAKDDELAAAESFKKQYERMRIFAKNWKTKSEELQNQLKEKSKVDKESQQLQEKESISIQNLDLQAKLTKSEEKMVRLEQEKKLLEDKLSVASTNVSTASTSNAVGADTADEANGTSNVSSTNAVTSKEEIDSLIRQAVGEIEVKYDSAMQQNVKLKEMNQKILTVFKQLRKQNADLVAMHQQQKQLKEIQHEKSEDQGTKVIEKQQDVADSTIIGESLDPLVKAVVLEQQLQIELPQQATIDRQIPTTKNIVSSFPAKVEANKAQQKELVAIDSIPELKRSASVDIAPDEVPVSTIETESIPLTSTVTASTSAPVQSHSLVSSSVSTGSSTASPALPPVLAPIPSPFSLASTSQVAGTADKTAEELLRMSALSSMKVKKSLDLDSLQSKSLNTTAALAPKPLAPSTLQAPRLATQISNNSFAMNKPMTATSPLKPNIVAAATAVMPTSSKQCISDIAPSLEVSKVDAGKEIPQEGASLSEAEEIRRRERIQRFSTGQKRNFPRASEAGPLRKVAKVAADAAETSNLPAEVIGDESNATENKEKEDTADTADLEPSIVGNNEAGDKASAAENA